MSVRPHSFNNASNYNAVNGYSPTDVTLMNVLGYDTALTAVNNFVDSGHISSGLSFANGGYLVGSGGTAINTKIGGTAAMQIGSGGVAVTFAGFTRRALNAQ